MSDPRKRRQYPSSRFRAGNGENTQRNSQSRQKMNPHQKGSHSTGNYNRQTSFDRVRKIIQEEGREARNLVQYSVPVEDELNQNQNIDLQQDFVMSYRIYEKTRSPYQRQSGTSQSPMRKPRNRSTSNSSSSSRDLRKQVFLDESGLKLSGRLSKKGDLRARYWAFLFENLKRAVDEIYQTCETDESEVECKEVIMMLEQCTKDFKSLIVRLNLLKAYENADEASKPVSLAWEIRKSSPGKGLSSSQNKETLKPTDGVSRSLNFTGQNIGNSWADKVKGMSPPQAPLMPTNIPLNVEADISQQIVQEHIIAEKEFFKDQDKSQNNTEDQDAEGWETVQRGRLKSKSNSRSSLNKDSISLSSESVHKSRHSSNSSEPYRRNNSKEEPLSPEIVPDKNILQHSEQSRNRTSSRDSEKENMPVQQTTKTEGTSKKLVTSPTGSPRVQGKSTSPKRPKRAEAKQVWTESAKQESQDNKGAAKTSEPTDSNVLPHSELCTPEPNEPSLEPDKSVELLSSEEDLSQTQDEEDLLATALVNAQEEEETLASELEKEQVAALEAADEEELSYLKAIEREESTEIIMEEEPESLANTMTSDVSSQQSVDWETMISQYDADSEYRSTHSWGDRAENDDVSRTPGKAVHMHEKLSSPSRKRSATQSRKRHEEKQQKAQELRGKLKQEKAERLRTLTKKVEEVRAWKEELLSQRKETIEKKMQRAEEKRQMQIKQKVRKAHEEETKANEIAFINTLEAQNKRHDIMAKRQEFEARLQDIQEERQRKHEEKAAKEAAVEERRKALQAEKKARLQEMQEKRRQRETEFEQRQQEREKERVEAARAKEKDREERITALNAMQQQHIEELQKKIQQKQDDSARRYKENMDQIKEKAFEMTVLKHSTEDQYDAPKLVLYSTKKFCNVCNVLIPSEVYLSSHLRGKKHLQVLKDTTGGRELSKNDIENFNLTHLSDAPSDKPDRQANSDKERQKSLKKRCKKLRQRMAQRGTEYESALSSKQQAVESEHRAKLQKLVKDLSKYIQTQDKGPWPQAKVSATDRALGEICRIMEKRVSTDQNAFRSCGGLTTLSRILLLISQSTPDLPTIIPPKSLYHTCNTMRLCCRGSFENCHYMLFSNKIGSLIDMLVHQLNMLIPDNFNLVLSQSLGGSASTLDRLPFDPVTSSLIQLIATILHCLAKNNPSSNASNASAERMTMSGDTFMNRANDILSYIVSVGVVDKLSQYFSNVRGPINDNAEAAEILQHGLGLLVAMAKLISKRGSNIFEIHMTDDPTQLITTLTHTELVGIVSLMYGMLLHSGATSRGDIAPPELPAHTLNVTLIGLRLLNNLATLDLKMLQNLLGAEGTSLEFRHISAHLLWYCGHCPNEELLHEVILSVGYFTVLNPDNQAIIQSGQPPTVLQQLCQLPFHYFSDPRLINVLFPTLIACCCHCQPNREILEQELSCDLLANFIEEKELEIQQAKLSPMLTKKSKVTEKETDRMLFSMRFPEEEWTTARKYFKND